jgi:hypothetical protein
MLRKNGNLACRSRVESAGLLLPDPYQARRKITMRTVSRLLPALLLVFLAGCAKPKDLIIGKWEVVEGAMKGQTLEFTKDGTVRMPTIGNLVAEVKYAFVNDDTVEVDMPVLFSKDVVKKTRYTVAIKKNEMTATDDKGKAMQMKRIP